jgi:hypothetical protein
MGTISDSCQEVPLQQKRRGPINTATSKKIVWQCYLLVVILSIKYNFIKSRFKFMMSTVVLFIYLFIYLKTCSDWAEDLKFLAWCYSSHDYTMCFTGHHRGSCYPVITITINSQLLKWTPSKLWQWHNSLEVRCLVYLSAVVKEDEVVLSKGKNLVVQKWKKNILGPAIGWHSLLYYNFICQTG